MAEYFYYRKYIPYEDVPSSASLWERKSKVVVAQAEYLLAMRGLWRIGDWETMWSKGAENADGTFDTVGRRLATGIVVTVRAKVGLPWQTSQ